MGNFLIIFYFEFYFKFYLHLYFVTGSVLCLIHFVFTASRTELVSANPFEADACKVTVLALLLRYTLVLLEKITLPVLLKRLLERELLYSLICSNHLWHPCPTQPSSTNCGLPKKAEYSSKSNHLLGLLFQFFL